METNRPNTASDPDSELFDAEAAAKYLWTQPSYIHYLREKGKLPAVRLRWNRWGFRKADLLAYARATNSDAVPAEQRIHGLPPKRTARLARLIESFGPPPPPPPRREDIFSLEEPPCARLVSRILACGVGMGASDIYLEPRDNQNVIFCSADGRVQEMFTLTRPQSDSTFRGISHNLKLKSNMDIYMRDPTRFGSMNYEAWQGNYSDYILRASVTNSHYGDGLILHILDQAMPAKGLAFCGMAFETEKSLNAACLGGGLFLFAGPRGSGRTTTAYTLLDSLNDGERCIHTMEEVTEYRLDGLTQKQTYYDLKLRPRDWLRGTLLSHPDLFFLGDIHDRETAAFAVEASLHGVPVLATIAARDSVDAIRRLIDFGITPIQAADCLRGVLSQHLLRRVCSECSSRDAVCEKCGGSGLKGRIGVFELLRVDEAIHNLLRRGATRGDLYDAACAGGMLPLYEDAAQKVHDGIIPLDEANSLSAHSSERLERIV